MWYHKSSGTNRWFVNGGDLEFTETINPIPKGHINEGDGLYFGDWNGDGITDVMWYDTISGNNRWYVNEGDLEFTETMNPIGNGQIDFGSLYFGDWNGDGITDVMYYYRLYGDNIWFTNNGNFEFNKIVNPLPKGQINLGDGLYFGDWNGDGITDVMNYRKSDGDNRWFTNNGSLEFTEKICPLAKGDVDDGNGLFFGDWNSDGITDVMWYNKSNGNNRWYTNNGDLDFTHKYNSIEPSDIDDGKSLCFGDWNGDGITDFMWYDKSSGNNRWYVNNGKPDLLTNYNNGLGATYSLEYTNSSSCNNIFLPFIFHPISKMKIDDGNGVTSVTNYSYEGGYFDFQSQEFRGFNKVGRIPHNGRYEETTFFQGNPSDPVDNYYYQGQRRLVSVKESSAANAFLISETINTYGLNDVEGMSKFPYLDNTNTKSYESSILATNSTEYFTYDDDGNILTNRTICSTDGSEAITKTNTYANLGSETQPIWRKTMDKIEGATSGQARQTLYRYYESGLSIGNLKETESENNKGQNPIVHYEYDTYGNLWKQWDAKGYLTTIEYDPIAHAFPAKITCPETDGMLHIVENEAWDYRYGKVNISKDENGNPTLTDYDEFGRLKQIDYPDGGQTIYQYDDISCPHSVSERIAETIDTYIDTTTYYDGLNRKIQNVAKGEAGKSIINRWQYDTMGHLSLAIGPFFGNGSNTFPQNPTGEYKYVSNDYDLRGRMVRVEKPDGQNGLIATQYSYNGHTTTLIDPDGFSKTQITDHLNRITKVIEHFNEGSDYTTSYTYNAAGDLNCVKDAVGNITTIILNTLGQKQSISDPDMGNLVYVYDINGNLETQTDAKSQTITFAYDALNRVKQKNYSSGENPVTYTYDDPTVPNGNGQLSTVSNGTVLTAHRSYDNIGRILEVSKTIANEGVFVTKNQYDLSGKPISMTFPGSDHYKINYIYFPGTGLLDKVMSESDAKVYAFCRDYQPDGKIGKVIYGNGAQTFYSYDPFSTRLITIETTYNNNLLLNRSYDYEPSGDIWKINDAVSGVDYFYSYDSLHRLTSETTSNGSPDLTLAVLDMQYNDVDHIHAVSETSVFSAIQPYDYDANGNLTSGPDLTDTNSARTRHAQYNADNMPTRISYDNGDLTTFAYNGNGARVVKRSPGGKKTVYVSENYEIIDGIAHKYIFAGNLRVAMVKGSETFYFHKDQLSSSTIMTRQDGTVYESTQYLPYGSQRGTGDITVTNYKFTDQEQDRTTGLYNYDARLYDPVIGRFVSADSVVPNWYNPQSLNRYSYCLNNPLIKIDPNGHSPRDFYWFNYFEYLWKNSIPTVTTGATVGVNLPTASAGPMVLAVNAQLFFDFSGRDPSRFISFGIYGVNNLSKNLTSVGFAPGPIASINVGTGDGWIYDWPGLFDEYSINTIGYYKSDAFEGVSFNLLELPGLDITAMFSEVDYVPWYQFDPSSLTLDTIYGSNSDNISYLDSLGSSYSNNSYSGSSSNSGSYYYGNDYSWADYY